MLDHCEAHGGDISPPKNYVCSEGLSIDAKAQITNLWLAAKRRHAGQFLWRHDQLRRSAPFAFTALVDRALPDQETAETARVTDLHYAEAAFRAVIE